MNPIPLRLSLVAQTRAILQKNIEVGTWGQWLPNELTLSAHLQISRVTLRAALAQLATEKIISSGRGRRRRILVRAKKTAGIRSNRILLLTPIPLEAMPRFELYWIDDIREHLAEAGFHLEIRQNSRCFSANPQGALEDLARQSSAAGWVLFQATAPVQKWFSQRRVPAVIAGSRYKGINLPFVDIDYRALCRHAVGRFLARGHRRLAFVNPHSGLVGDLDSEQGYLEAIQASAAGGARGCILRHNYTTDDICRRINTLLTQPDRPTAFLVSKAFHALTVFGHLQRRGLRVPEDCSLISRDNEAYLAHTIPAITRYAANPETLAKKISRLLLEMISSGITVTRECRIMPAFVPGGTLAEFHPKI